MIGRLNGTLISKKPPQLLVDVAGVGYEVDVSMNTIYQSPAEEQNIILYTHLVVREDQHALYGFIQEQERALFRTLIKVNGVGPKLALTILSTMTVTLFVNCVRQQNIAELIKVPGIGKKTAERLLIEIRDRLSDFSVGDAGDSASSDDPNIIVRHTAVQDAISALIALGYKPHQAELVITKLDCENQSSEDIIRMALKQLQRA